jgi:signal transduction histidine kinase
MVSHDLKTPLSSIKGATENILEELAGPVNAHQRTYLEMIMKSSSDLQRMITDLLDLSRIESGHLTLNIEKVDIVHELDELRRSMRPIFDMEGVELIIVSSASGTVVEVDRTRLWQILSNILTNAAMHSPAGGTIRVKIEDVPVDKAGGRAMLGISVTDQGSGIGGEEGSRLFEPFYSRPSATTGRKGVGLGLAIVKQLVELHGGRVSIENAPEGGAIVTFTIPAG